MSQMDKLIDSLINADARKWGVDEALQVYEELSANPDLRDGVLSRFEHFDSTAQRLLAHILFVPETATQKPLFSICSQNADINASDIADESPDVTSEATAIGLLIQATLYGHAETRFDAQLLSVIEAFEIYRHHIGAYQNTKELNRLWAAANYLSKTGDAMAFIPTRDPERLGAQQGAQYSIYQKVLDLCVKAKEHPDFEKTGEHTLEVHRIKKGTENKMAKLDELRGQKDKKGKGGTGGSAAPQDGFSPLGNLGGGFGIAAAPYLYTMQSATMTSALSFVRPCLPIF